MCVLITEDLLQEVYGKVFSVIYQILIAEKDIPKAGITTPFGSFEFTRSST